MRSFNTSVQLTNFMLLVSDSGDSSDALSKGAANMELLKKWTYNA